MDLGGVKEFPPPAEIVGSDGSSMLSTSIGESGHDIVARLLTLIARRGGNAAGVLRVNGFEEPLDQFIVNTLPTLEITNLQKLSSRASVELSDMQASAAGRPPFRGGDWRLLFYCLVGSRTLREAIMRTEELLLAIDGRMGSMALKRSGGKAILSYTGARSGDEEMDFIVTLHGQLMFHSIFSWLIGKPIESTLALDFPESAERYLNAEPLPFNLLLGAEQLELRFAASLLDQPIIRTMSDCEALPTLNFLFGLRVGEDPLEIVRRSRHLMAMALRERRKLPSLEELARHLAVAPMTLRRRLQSAGTSFRVIRDELRREMAIDMLTNSRMSIEDIAERLDLCDSDALRRAFRGWTGMAPTEFRRTLVKATIG
jgi:AraC-like DNA-binding protein